jgi:hypothetical protein
VRPGDDGIGSLRPTSLRHPVESARAAYQAIESRAVGTRATLGEERRRVHRRKHFRNGGGHELIDAGAICLGPFLDLGLDGERQA